MRAMNTPTDFQMDWQSALSAISDTNNALFWIALILLGIFLVQLILFIIWGVQARQIRQIRRRYRKLLSHLGSEQGGDLLHQLLTEQESLQAQVAGLKQELAQCTQEMARLKQEQAQHVSRVGMIRYNAFRETGNDLSFSVAWVNERLDGVVITSIYSRGECSVYAKPLSGGQSAYPLSPEEQEAIQHAAASKVLDQNKRTDGNKSTPEVPLSRA
ncbi:MAG: hypothetical protein BAA01_04805 [Bacillus thermozeamaize]|mgnify:CR=1 FL=1|uniref:DUF4446 domain-containing protein n=1 Tax=Bacillus thermozeamaize TaxID=230954 RepID=A0A1Y3PKJ6_9BACI|nr:MAG: hypothetical protein BAA01_04805 [Bacillus thermozeamaize]